MEHENPRGPASAYCSLYGREQALQMV